MNRSNRTDGLVVVHARDEVNRALAGHGGREYVPRTSIATRSRSWRCCSNDPSSPTKTIRPAGAGRLPAGNARSPWAPVPRPTAARSANEPALAPARTAPAGSTAGKSSSPPTSQLAQRGVGT